MARVLRIGDREMVVEEMMPLLTSYEIMPHLLRENIIDRAIAAIDCTPEEIATAIEQFDRHWGLADAAERLAWQEYYGMSQEQLEGLATRKLRIEKFKQATWGHRLETYFLKRKGQLDRAIYSLIRTKDKGMASELYFRISEGEQSLTELARDYSEGPEAQTGGMLGPVELGTLHPALARLLLTSQPGELRLPVPLGEWYAIVRLEKLIPAQFNEFIRQRLLNELFQTWLQEQLHQLPHQERGWLGAAANRQAGAAANVKAV